MQIKQITDNNFKNEWNRFVIKNSSPSIFLQSWEWGEFKSNPIRFGVFENNELIAVAQFFKIALPAGKFYLNCPKGPIIKFPISNFQFSIILNLLKSEIKKIAKKENIIFIRIAPQKKPVDNFTKPKILQNLIEPENTLVLNLKNSEEEILKEMHQKTRYNIRLAEKKGVKIFNFQFSIFNKVAKQKLDEFYKLIKITAQRDKMNIFSKKYYEDLLENSACKLLTAEHDGQILSTIILYSFGNTCTYLYGASSNEKRNLMPNYLIQWEAIKWAKQNEFKYYDFWGISKQKNNWGGITKFKQGFVSEKTGQEINSVGAFDFVLNKKWYNLYRVGKMLKIRK